MAITVRKKLSEIVGGGYRDFWRDKSRYRIVKGGRGSKKSTTTALNTIHRMEKYPLSNALIIRQIYKDHRDSTYAQLKWACYQLGVQDDWQFKVSPLEMVKKSTGQKILFRGLDDPLSITSITVERGYLNQVWFEEGFQIRKEDDFDKIDVSIRGQLPPGYFKQLTITLNPWSDRHWIKARFFDDEDEDVFTQTTTYKDNEFLGDDDRRLFEKMKKTSPRRYNVEGLGHWGISTGVIFDNWVERDFDVETIAAMRTTDTRYGLDFGFTNDPTAAPLMYADVKNRKLWVYDEIYESGLLTNQVADKLREKNIDKERIVSDSSEPRMIQELKTLHNIPRIEGAKKGAGSVIQGIEFLRQFEIIVHPHCQNTIVEFSNYAWDKDKFDKTLNKPIDDFNHIIDAMRYAVERDSVKRKAGISSVRA